jgi:ribose transport system permease protein
VSVAVALDQPPARDRGGVRRVLRKNSFSFALLLAVVLLILNLVVQSNFGWTDQLATFAPLAVAAMASTPAIISGRGGFDLSISPSMTLISALFVVWLVPAGLGGIVSVPILLLIAGGLGALNGMLIVGLRVPAMVVTLAMYFIVIGVDLLLVPTPMSLGDDSWVLHLAGTIGPVPGGLVTIGVTLAIWGALKLVPFSRLLYAVGSDDAASFASGVNVGFIRVSAYALGGVFAGIGGLALTGLVSSADSSQASAYTLVAIAGVALGGTPLTGGRGGLLGSLLGAAVIYLVQSLLSGLQVSHTWLEVMYGLILILAVVVGAKLNEVPGRQL